MTRNQFNPKLIKFVHQISTFFLSIVFIASLLVILAWFLNIDFLKNLLPNLATMKFNTALCFICMVISLHYAENQPRTSYFIVSVVIFIAFSSLVEDIFHINIGIDELIVADNAKSSAPPGRMSNATAILFMISGFAFLFFKQRRIVIGQIWSIGLIFIALLSLAGYIYSVHALYAVGPFSTIALHTTLNFLILGGILLFLYPDQGLMALVHTIYLGGHMARRLLPVIIFLPLFLAWLALLGYRADWYDIEFGIAMMTLANIFIASGLVMWTAYFINKIDMERAQAHEQLLLSENRYYSMIATLSEGIILSDGSGTFQPINKAVHDILDLDSSETLKADTIRRKWNIIREDGSILPQGEFLSEQSFETGKSYLDTVMGFQKPDLSDTKWLMINSNPMYLDNNTTQPHAVILSLTDITARREAETHAFEVALEKERLALLRQFVEVTRHEFRTPLTIMQSNLYLLKSLTEPKQGLPKIEIIEKQIQRVIRLVDILVTLTRLDNRTDFKLEKLNINYLIGLLEKQSEKEFRENELTLQMDLAEDLPNLNVDKKLMLYGIQELLNNSIRYTEKGGTITVKTSQDNTYVHIVVQDTGQGIPQEAVENIFELFYRQDTAHKTPGFGLGLVVAKRIIELHSGTIQVESEVGRGSLFTISLPIEMPNRKLPTQNIS